MDNENKTEQLLDSTREAARAVGRNEDCPEPHAMVFIDHTLVEESDPLMMHIGVVARGEVGQPDKGFVVVVSADDTMKDLHEIINRVATDPEKAPGEDNVLYSSRVFNMMQWAAGCGAVQAEADEPEAVL